MPMTCRSCGRPWTVGRVVTSFGSYVTDSVRRYCRPWLANGAADRVEAELRRWDL